MIIRFVRLTANMQEIDRRKAPTQLTYFIIILFFQFNIIIHRHIIPVFTILLGERNEW